MAADLADHHDRLGLVISQKHVEHIGEIEAMDRVAADPDAARLPEPRRRCLRHRLIRQGAGARYDADLAAPVDMPRHDADLAFVGRDDAGAVRPDQRTLRTAERALDAHHVDNRDALGDAHDELDPGIDRFKDRIGRIGRRHVDDAGRRAGLGARLPHCIEHRHVEMLRAAFPRRHAPGHLRAVGDRLLRMERALRAGEALTDDRRRGVDEDRHHAASLMTSTTFRAASSRLSAAISGNPDCPRILRPNSTFVPSSRTTSGTCRLTSRAAATMPSAMTSQRMMPPKLLTRIASPFGSDRISLKAIVTRSLLAPPPTSRKLAGSPP